MRRKVLSWYCSSHFLNKNRKVLMKSSLFLSTFFLLVTSYLVSSEPSSPRSLSMSLKQEPQTFTENRSFDELALQTEIIATRYRTQLTQEQKSELKLDISSLLSQLKKRREENNSLADEQYRWLLTIIKN